MKNALFALVAVFFLGGQLQLSAQTLVTVNVNGVSCQAAMISDAEAENGQYGWWSTWHDKKKNNAPMTPTAFELSPGTYTLVVYYDSRGANSDGMALEKISISSYMKSLTFELNTSDFTEWNCLSCPWLCVFDGKEYNKHSEVLQDVTGFDNRTTTITQLDATTVVDGKVRLRIQEEKDEISFIDQIRLKVGDEYLTAQKSQLDAKDNDFLRLEKGEKVDLEFTMPDSWTQDQNLQLEVSGYYDPQAEFLAEITRKLLERN